MSFEPTTACVKAEQLAGGSTNICGPKVRASHSNVIHDNKLYVFGGQDDDNNKLGDLWTFDLNSKQWSEIGDDVGGFKPIARSGHTAVVWGQKMYIFGGILELTKELNDMVVYDFAQNKFVGGENAAESKRPEPLNTRPNEAREFQEQSSPTRTQKGLSPTKRKTMMGQTNTPGLKKGGPLKSPTKIPAGEKTAEKQDGLSSPTSISMQNTFLIKNADQSFDAYFQQMRKRKAGHFGATQ